jgi:TRAP-type C4-dicarboxylate transport system permease large subunit
VACAVAGATVEEAMRPSIIYTLVLIAGLAAVAAVPEVTTFLPNLLGLP